MVRAFLLAAVTGGLLVVPGGAAAKPQPGGEKAAGPGVVVTAEKNVAVLQGVKVSYEKDLQTTPLSEALADLATRYQITFVINKAAFTDTADQLPDAKATRLSATKLEGMTLGTFLDIYLRGLSVPDVTYMVRPDHIEITTREAAQKEAGLMEAIDEAKAGGDPAELVRAKARLNLPLVCVAVESKPLGTVLNDLSRTYGLNIVVDSQIREGTKLMLTERLLNVPADTALGLLAGQAGLFVVRKGNTFRVTGSPGAQ
ncbi:MAG: hypothetical protein JWO38_5957 [Gemmataceae bacterium]|nr:hypothetical protein [Gemmataceae bacterium]